MGRERASSVEEDDREEVFTVVAYPGFRLAEKVGYKTVDISAG
jgi:hypothetical protein